MTQIFTGFRDHEAAEEKASAPVLELLRPALVGTPWELRWQHTGGGCSAWELYSTDTKSGLDRVAVYLTGGEGDDSSARIGGENGMMIGAIDAHEGTEFPGMDYVEVPGSFTAGERVAVILAFLKRVERTAGRLIPSIAAAQDAFFAALAAQWPEATTGDLYPDAAVRFQNAAASAAHDWICANVRDSILVAASVAGETVTLTDGREL